MDHCTDSQGGDHKERSDKGLAEQQVCKDPGQAGNPSPEGGDKNAKSEIAGHPFTALKSVKQRLLIPKHEDKAKYGD